MQFHSMTLEEDDLLRQEELVGSYITVDYNSPFLKKLKSIEPPSEKDGVLWVPLSPMMKCWA